MRTFYDGYRLSEDAETRIYNPTLSLYFLDHSDRRGQYSRRMLDENLAMDHATLVYIARVPHGETLFIAAPNNTEGVTIPKLGNALRGGRYALWIPAFAGTTIEYRACIAETTS